MRGAVFEAALLLAAGLAVVECTLCSVGETFWSPDREACLDCTRCDDKRGLVVLRPCHIHQDTVCGPLEDLGIDWSWLHHRHAKHRNNAKPRKIVWRFSPAEEEQDVSATETTTAQLTTTTTTTTTTEDYEVNNYLDYDSAAGIEVPFESEPFTSDNEKFVWDWQTVMLVLAAFSCLLFFVVVAVYAAYNARQWRMIKDNLEADVEGLTAKLNLMMAYADANRHHISETSSPQGSENQYSNVRCAYLEQLLVGKSKGRPGNVYIQENNY